LIQATVLEPRHTCKIKVKRVDDMSLEVNSMSLEVDSMIIFIVSLVFRKSVMKFAEAVFA
jgi:hypothetical protein